MRKHPETLFQELVHYFRYDLKDELMSFGKWIRYYLSLWIIGAVVVAGLYAYFNTGTNKVAVLGYGQAGSSFRNVAEDYKTFFERNGLHLDLSEVSHIGESVDQLQKEAAPINASFILAGSKLGSEEQKLASLGSIKFAPGWLFYRGPAMAGASPFTGLAGKRVSIGPAGSFSNRFLRELYAVAKPPDVSAIEIVELSDTDGTTALLTGEIDAIWIIDSAASDNVRKLVAAPGLQIFSWELADAYIEKLPYLSKLKLPAGYFDIGNVRPPQDITLLSTTVTMLIEADLHPALQWGFLLAARDYASSHYEDLSGDVAFPKYLDKSVPLSPIAERYFNEGVPSLFSYLPLFYASLVERTWIWIVGAFVIGYPLFHSFMNFREFHARWTMMHNFDRLRSYEEMVVDAQSVAEVDRLSGRIDAFEEEILDHWVAEENIKDYYLLRAAFGRTREAIALKRKKLST